MIAGIRGCDNLINKQPQQEMDQSFHSNLHNKELTSFFSSYLSDLTLAVSEIRDLVLTLINVKLNPLPPQQVPEDMISIVAACRKAYNDLKKTQSLLRGHVKAKQASKIQKSRVSAYSGAGQLVYSRNASNSWSESPQTPFFTMKSIKQSCNFEKSKQQSATTFISRCTEQQNKSNHDQKNISIKQSTYRHQGEFLQSAAFKKTKDSSSEKLQNSRVKSLQIVKRLEELREISSQQLVSFQNKNTQCLTIIKQMKEQVKLKQKQSKLKKKTHNK